jgi:hypothetical protein
VIETTLKSAVLSIIAGGLLLAGCSGEHTDSSSRSATSSTTLESAHRTATSSVGEGTVGISPTVRSLPAIGAVVISRTSGQGIVIRDKATNGRRFFLADEQAGECLSFLESNPDPSRQAVRAACPGTKP